MSFYGSSKDSEESMCHACGKRESVFTLWGGVEVCEQCKNAWGTWPELSTPRLNQILAGPYGVATVQRLTHEWAAKRKQVAA